MKTLVIGANGSMGKRYQAILKFFNRPFVCADIQHDDKFIVDQMLECTEAIIATPTKTHAHFIKLLAPIRKAILCEKPVVTDLVELHALLKLCTDYGTPFMMMNQYKLLYHPDSIGGSFYDYFRHGTDGLAWDCMQIIGLARGKIEVREESPVWKCTINGKPLSIRDMDSAYLEYVRRWLWNPNQSHEEIIKLHEKTAEFERAMNG